MGHNVPAPGGHWARWIRARTAWRYWGRAVAFGAHRGQLTFLIGTYETHWWDGKKKPSCDQAINSRGSYFLASPFPVLGIQEDTGDRPSVAEGSPGSQVFVTRFRRRLMLSFSRPSIAFSHAHHHLENVPTDWNAPLLGYDEYSDWVSTPEVISDWLPSSKM